MKKVSILMGSESDKNIADRAVEVLEKYHIPYDLNVASAHREPARVREIVRTSDADVFICVAGLSAALPGVVASMTAKPVIGVPVEAKLLGLDALLSTVQMPPGVPVAAVGIDNGKNAAYLALRILALQYTEILTTTPSTPSESSYEPSSSTMSESPDVSGFPLFSPTSESTVPGVTETEAEKKKRPSGDWL